MSVPNKCCALCGFIKDSCGNYQCLISLEGIEKQKVFTKTCEKWLNRGQAKGMMKIAMDETQCHLSNALHELRPFIVMSSKVYDIYVAIREIYENLERDK
jgi:hypothetical protein